MKKASSFYPYEEELYDFYRFECESTSKGNQIKWYFNNRYYKADSFGYEGLAESFSYEISKFIKSPIEWIKYTPCRIKENHHIYNGCFSENFLKENETLVSFHRILRSMHGNDYRKYLSGSIAERMLFVCDSIKEYCKVDIKLYLFTIILFDAIILNEDRHLNNLTVIKGSNGYYTAPIFDNGLALLSDLRDYPLDNSTVFNMKNVKAKPFSNTFSKQVDAVKSIMPTFRLQIEEQTLSVFLADYQNSIYEKNIVGRCNQVIKKRLLDTKNIIWEAV